MIDDPVRLLRGRLGELPRLHRGLLERRDVPMAWNARELRVVKHKRRRNCRMFRFEEREPLVALSACDARIDRCIGLLEYRCMRAVDSLRDVDDVRQGRQRFDAALPGSEAGQREVMLERQSSDLVTRQRQQLRLGERAAPLH
ncbi:hypothetical protein F3J14_28275 [Burkholderia sp. Tr-862]|uniref:hypothetical protein n=1 Tax=Burkholderia sp. Tr-862 TaxID=2608331 RepID=UPI001419BF9A|nr:hypothetical protein [Burkholderia sp. Tr-862]NIF44694.1 hypothetical protein [Burkholderia sp. Tr-862]